MVVSSVSVRYFKDSSALKLNLEGHNEEEWWRKNTGQTPPPPHPPGLEPLFCY